MPGAAIKTKPLLAANSQWDGMWMLLESPSSGALSDRKYCPWAATARVGSDCVFATSSHCHQAMKKIKRHLKTVGQS
jgi:hypothetical protein